MPYNPIFSLYLSLSLSLELPPNRDRNQSRLEFLSAIALAVASDGLDLGKVAGAVGQAAYDRVQGETIGADAHREEVAGLAVLVERVEKALVEMGWFTNKI